MTEKNVKDDKAQIDLWKQLLLVPK